MSDYPYRFAEFVLQNSRIVGPSATAFRTHVMFYEHFGREAYSRAYRAMKISKISQIEATYDSKGQEATRNEMKYVWYEVSALYLNSKFTDLYLV